MHLARKGFQVLQCKYTFTSAVFRHPYLGQIPSQVILVPGRAAGSIIEFLGIYRVMLWFISQNMEMAAATNRWWRNTARQSHRKTSLLQPLFLSMSNYALILFYPQNKSKTFYKIGTDMNTLCFDQTTSYFSWLRRALSRFSYFFPIQTLNKLIEKREQFLSGTMKIILTCMENSVKFADGKTFKCCDLSIMIT